MNDAVDVLATPTGDQLIDELGSIVAIGASAIAVERNASQLQGLLSLTCVTQASAPVAAARARRLIDVLSRVVARLPDEGDLRRALGILVGTASGYRLVRSTERRAQVARLLHDEGMSGASFLRRHQDDALAVVAEELLRFEEQFRLRAIRQVMASDGPVFNALATQWLDQFGYYYRIWTDLNGLRNDLSVYLRRRKRSPTQRALASYLSSSLWYYARFRHNAGRFLDERGGIWMFSDQTIDQAVADAVYLAGWYAPFSDREDSWLVLALILQQPSPTLILFEHELEQATEGRAALKSWTSWLSRCECDMRAPATECPVHQVIRNADRYCAHVDSEWIRIAGWYRLPPAGVRELAAPDSDSSIG